MSGFLFKKSLRSLIAFSRVHAWSIAFSSPCFWVYTLMKLFMTGPVLAREYRTSCSSLLNCGLPTLWFTILWNWWMIPIRASFVDRRLLSTVCKTCIAWSWQTGQGRDEQIRLNTLNNSDALDSCSGLSLTDNVCIRYQVALPHTVLDIRYSIKTKKTILEKWTT